MKKKVFTLFLTVLFVMFPMVVHAADSYTGVVFGSEDEAMTKTTLNNATITCPKTTDGKYATCYIGIKVTAGTAKSFTVDATLTNMTYNGLEEKNGWSMKSSPVQSGNNITFEFTNKTGVAAGKTVIVAEVTYKVNNLASECGIKFTNTTSGEEEPKTCEVSDGKYYCKNGAECTKTQYEVECTPENPQTGSMVPYVIVIAGLGVAGALYFATRKKAKIYHV